jgi:Copper transport outer membrane protein, MctB
LIDFRYHIVSLIAVFLALALGLFLGSTTLQSTVTGSLTNQANRVTKENKKLGTQKQSLSGQVKSEQSLINAVEPYAVSGRLLGESVALVTAPGVSGSTHDGLVGALTDAGATVSADVALQPAFLDPTQDSVLGSLASDALPNHPLPQGNGATRASVVLADVLAARLGRHAPTHAQVSTALNVLEAGNFIKVSGTPAAQPADLTVLLVAAPSANLTAATAQAQNAILVSLARDLRSSSSGTVVAGPRPAGSTDLGALSAARADPTLTKSVSTVNLDDSTSLAVTTTGGDAVAGRIAIVLALAAAPAHTVGAYGLGPGLTGPLPTPTSTP